MTDFFVSSFVELWFVLVVIFFVMVAAYINPGQHSCAARDLCYAAVAFLCTLQCHVYFVQFCTELLVGVGKVGYGFACMQNCCMVAVSYILANL